MHKVPSAKNQNSSLCLEIMWGWCPWMGHWVVKLEEGKLRMTGLEKGGSWSWHI